MVIFTGQASEASWVAVHEAPQDVYREHGVCLSIVSALPPGGLCSSPTCAFRPQSSRTGGWSARCCAGCCSARSSH